jgi:AraC family transcriptional regulator of adaptative response / DNA-3-methyladenine glycosylase II
MRATVAASTECTVAEGGCLISADADNAPCQDEAMPVFDHDRCYRALASQDARFDGQFIVGVHSTGIYCRPSCPAITTPQPHDVQFFAVAAAAHEAGLRACRHCLMIAVPGNPHWNLRDDLTARAMRLILDGVVEREGVTGLANRLSCSAGHLTRILIAELGAGPLTLARAHRAETARALLAGTDLPVSQVALAAGFASIQQFNETMFEVHEMTPIALRTLAQTAWPGPDNSSSESARNGDDSGGTTVTLWLAARNPFDGVGAMQFIADHAITGVERLINDHDAEDECAEEDAGKEDAGKAATHRAPDASAPIGVERWITLPQGAALTRVTLDPQRAGVHVSARLAAVADVGALTARIRRWFDLDTDAAAIDAALNHDPLLRPLVASTPGIRIPGSADPAETLLRTIMGQQISLPAARTMQGRLAAYLADPADPAALLRFPTSTQIARRGAEVLRGPERRVRTIIDTAEALATGALVLDVGLTTAELRERLLRMPGIGPWTAAYVAMRVLGSPDFLLHTDLVVLRSLQARGAAATPREAASLGERWAPWRSYATLHLWRAAPPSHRARPV